MIESRQSHCYKNRVQFFSPPCLLKAFQTPKLLTCLDI